MSRSRSVFFLLLLFLTAVCVKCATRKVGAPGQAAQTVDEETRQQFEAEGVAAPLTVIDPGEHTAKLNKAQLAHAFGEAQEVSEEELARLAAKGQAKPTSVEDTETPDTEAERRDRAIESVTGLIENTDEGNTFTEARPEPPAKTPAPDPPRVAPQKKAAVDRDDLSKSIALEQSIESGGLKETKSAEEVVDRIRDAKEKEKREEADGEGRRTVLPAVARAPKLGKILVVGSSGKLEAIKPRAIRVVAHIQGPRARTVVDYVFENPHDRRLEGTFYYPLPADGSPAGFSMFDGAAQVHSESFFKSNRMLPALTKPFLHPHRIDEIAKRKSKGTIDWKQRKDARVVEQKRAREVYEEIVRSNVDPALLEWSGGSKFQARVFPLEPRSLKRITLAYEQPLVFDGRRFRYNYVMPAEQTIRERAATIFVDRQHGKIVAAPAGAKKSEGDRWTRFELKNAPQGADLSVAVAPPTKHAVLRGKDSSGLPGDAFYAQVRPEIKTSEQRPTGRAILLVDSSLSAEEGGAHARRAQLIEAILGQDTTIEEYAVLLFDVRPRWLGQRNFRPNNKSNRAETVHDLRRIFLEGATNFSAVLAELEAQRSWAIDGAPTTVFLLSDGEITWGLDRLEALPARHPVLRDVRFITYRFGEAPANQALFDLLSRESRGRTVSLLSANEVAKAAVAHRASPVELVNVAVEGAEAVDVTVAGQVRLLFPGQMLQVAGRLPKGGKAQLVLSIRTGEQTNRLLIPLGEKGNDDFAPRAWAEIHTRHLIAMDDVRVDRMVVALSQHYRLANARSSFLILDNEQQVADYKIADEQVDLSNLDILRRQEEDQRRDRLLGIALDEVTELGREVVKILKKRTDGMAPILKAQPLLEAPFSGGKERIAEEKKYRARRQEEKLDYLMYDQIARVRALAGDTAGAVRSLSTTVELRPRDTEAMRLVGYALLALSQYAVAAELFERIRLLRPFEGQAFLEEALALDAVGRFDLAARNYEIVLSRSWNRHDSQVKTTAAFHYARMLTAVGRAATLSATEKKKVEDRIAELTSTYEELHLGQKIDFQLTIHWSTDSIDIDLWVFEPNGEKCYYQNDTTQLGGHLYWDITDGLGPELYQSQKATEGPYDTLVHYYGSGAPRMRAPTALLMVVDRDAFSKGGPTSRQFLMRMLPKKDAVLMMRTDVF